MQRVTRHYKAQNRKWGELFITGMITCCVLGTIYIFNIGITTLALIGSFILLYLLRYPRKTFLLFVFSIPLAEIYVKTPFLAISVTNILILIIILSLITKFFIVKPKVSVPPLIKANLFALFIWVLSYVIGAIHSIDVSVASRRIITSVGMALSFVLPLALISDLEQYRKVFIFLIASALLLAFATILAGFGYVPEAYQSIFATRMGTSRAIIGKCYTQAFMSSRGGYGCWLESALSMTMLSIFYKKKLFLKNSALPLMAFILILGIVIPSSRSSWLAASSAIFIILLFVLRQRFGFRYSIMLIVSSLTVLSLYKLGLIQPFVNNLYEMSPESVDRRFLIYRDALRVAIESPIFGWGYRAYEMRLGSIFPGMEIHNVFLSTFVSNGILALIPLIFIWGISFYLCLQTIMRPISETTRLFGISIFASLIAILIEAQFYGGGDKIMWLMLGLTNCLYKLNNNQTLSGANLYPLGVHGR